jgi:flagellar hook assembly protein FlgD
VKDTTTIKAAFDAVVKWNLQIRSSAGVTLRTWTGTGSSLSIVWDGKNSTGYKVPDGTYTVRLSGTDLLGVAFTTKTGTVTVDTKPPSVTSVSVYPTSFKPSTAQTTKINYTLSESCYVTIQIYNSANSLKRTLLNNVLQSNGFHSVVWNGKDSSNLIVPAGIYTVKIYVVDKAGNKALTYPIIKTVTVI